MDDPEALFPFLELPKDAIRLILEKGVGKPFLTPEIDIRKALIVTTFEEEASVESRFFKFNALLRTSPSLCLAALSVTGPQDYAIRMAKVHSVKDTIRFLWLAEHRAGQLREALGSVRPFQLVLSATHWKNKLALLQLSSSVDVELFSYSHKSAKSQIQSEEQKDLGRSLPIMALRSLYVRVYHTGGRDEDSGRAVSDFFEALSACTALKELVLEVKKLHCLSVLDCLSLPPYLERLELKGRGAGGLGVWKGSLGRVLQTGPRLKAFGIGTQTYDSVQGKYLEALLSAPDSLTRLDVSCIRVKSAGDLQHLARLAGLQHLSLRSANIEPSARLADLLMSFSCLTTLDLGRDEYGASGKISMGFSSDKEDGALRLLASCPRLTYLDLSALRGSADGRSDLQALRAESERLTQLKSNSKLSGIGGKRIITIKAMPFGDDSDQNLYQYDDEGYYFTMATDYQTTDYQYASFFPEAHYHSLADEDAAASYADNLSDNYAWGPSWGYDSDHL